MSVVWPVRMESYAYVAVHGVCDDVRASVEQVRLPCTVVGPVSCSVGALTRSVSVGGK